MSNNNNNNNNNNNKLLKPYSSVKRLNLLPKRLNEHSYINNSGGDGSNSSAFKRFRLNNNGEDDQLTDSINEQQHHQQTSRLSCISTSSASSSIRKFGQTNSIRSGYESMNMNNLSLSSSSSSSVVANNRKSLNHQHRESYFYSGKTIFGGSNLQRKNNNVLHHHRLTPYYSPYSRIKCINEPSSSNFNDEDLPLSSLTQRILDRLDKAAATPLSDAKSRLSISSSINNNKKFNDDDNDKIKLKKLFDTPTPTLNNHLKNESSFKPIMTYILKPTSTTINESTNVDQSINDDIEKLNQLKKAEKQLKQQESLQQQQNFAPSSMTTSTSSSGKITSRDVKKGRKIIDKIDDVVNDERNDLHLKLLANVKPLSGTTMTLKPFTLSDNNCNNKFDIEKSKFNNNDNGNKCDNNDSNCTTITKEFSFKFSSPKLVASLNHESMNQSSIEATIKKIDFSSPMQINKQSTVELSVTSTPAPASTSLFELFNGNNNNNNNNTKTTKTWSCTVCCTKNDDIDLDDKCIACEEPNVNKKSKELSTDKTIIVKKDLTTKTWTCTTCLVSNNITEKRCVSCDALNPTNAVMMNQKQQTPASTSSSLMDLFSNRHRLKNQWTCSVCMVPNESNADKCVSCEEPNPNNIKSSTTTTTTTFGFKFGTATTTGNDDNCSKIKQQNNKTIEKEWQCFYCKATNDDSIVGGVCKECGKIKVMAATMDQVQKFYQTQTFKFGLSNSSQQQKDATGTTTLFKFGSSDLTSTTTTSLFSSSKITAPFSSSLSSPFSLSTTTTTTASTNTTSTTTTTTLSSAPTIRNLFNFGGKPLPSSSSSSTTTENKCDAVDAPTTSSSSTSTSSTTSASTFSFGGNNNNNNNNVNNKNDEKESTDNDKDNCKTLFGFNSATLSSTIESSSIPPSTSSGLFNFGQFKSSDPPPPPPTAAEAAKPFEKPSLSNMSFSNKDNASFTFGDNKTTTTVESSSTTTTTTTISTSNPPLLFGKNLNFGSPINTQKIDTGPAIPKMTISFAHPGTVTTTTTTSSTNSLFSFGAAGSLSLSSSSNNNNNSTTPSLFGSGSTTIPSSFNFMQNNTNNSNNNNNNTNSPFTFAAKTINEQSDNKPSTAVTTGFNFGNPMGSFDSSSGSSSMMFNSQQQQQQQAPSLFKFGSSQDPPPPGSSMSSNLTFQSFSTNNNNDNNNAFTTNAAVTPLIDSQQPQYMNLFQFQPSNNTMQQQQRPTNIPATRMIKKAKRRLNNK